MRWTLESLESWGRDQGLRPRKISQGVMFQRRGQTMTAFSIYLSGLDAGHAAEIAFNPKDDVADRALRFLADTLPAAVPKSSWKWRRLGLSRHDDEVLASLAARIREAAPAAPSPKTAPASTTKPAREIAGLKPAPAPVDDAITPTGRDEPAAAETKGARSSHGNPDAHQAVGPDPGRKFKRKPTSMVGLEDLGRVRLSRSFFLRDFLFSEIAAMNGFSNIPDHPDVAIAAGQGLCEHLLEPLQAHFGRIAIRSAYRSSEVNAFGNANRLNCSSNASSYGRHIWDHRDDRGCLGATACIVVPAFIDYHARTGHWEALAWWIHDHLPYSRMEFYPQLGAFNLTWSEQPERRIASRTPPRLGMLTKPGMDNFEGDHAGEYAQWLRSIAG